MNTQSETELDILKPRELVVGYPRLPAMSAEAIEKVRHLESITLDRDCLYTHLTLPTICSV